MTAFMGFYGGQQLKFYPILIISYLIIFIIFSDSQDIWHNIFEGELVATLESEVKRQRQAFFQPEASKSLFHIGAPPSWASWPSWAPPSWAGGRWWGWEAVECTIPRAWLFQLWNIPAKSQMCRAFENTFYKSLCGKQRRWIGLWNFGKQSIYELVRKPWKFIMKLINYLNLTGGQQKL